eukprot:gene7472-5267_t
MDSNGVATAFFNFLPLPTGVERDSKENARYREKENTKRKLKKRGKRDKRI